MGLLQDFCSFGKIGSGKAGRLCLLLSIRSYQITINVSSRSSTAMPGKVCKHYRASVPVMDKRKSAAKGVASSRARVGFSQLVGDPKL